MVPARKQTRATAPSTDGWWDPAEAPAHVGGKVAVLDCTSDRRGPAPNESAAARAAAVCVCVASTVLRARAVATTSRVIYSRELATHKRCRQGTRVALHACMRESGPRTNTRPTAAAGAVCKPGCQAQVVLVAADVRTNRPNNSLQGVRAQSCLRGFVVTFSYKLTSK